MSGALGNPKSVAVGTSDRVLIRGVCIVRSRNVLLFDIDTHGSSIWWGTHQESRHSLFQVHYTVHSEETAGIFDLVLTIGNLLLILLMVSKACPKSLGRLGSHDVLDLFQNPIA